MKREKEATYIATISGGKDSTAMCDLLLANGYQVDYIVFNDTLNEFDLMYKYLNKVEKYFKRKYNKKITRLYPDKNADFTDSMFRKRVKGERKGKVAGLRNATDPFCEWRSTAKIRPFEKFVKQFKDYKIYIGIALDEAYRANRGDPKLLYPLIDNFKMTEADCLQYLKERDMENPLYKYFTRTGCAACHYRTDRDFYMIWKHFPKVWQYYKDIEKRMSKEDTEFKYWFTKHRTCDDMEKLFKKKEQQGSLFDFDDEPVKDCFCKI